MFIGALLVKDLKQNPMTYVNKKIQKNHKSPEVNLTLRIRFQRIICNAERQTPPSLIR